MWGTKVLDDNQEQGLGRIGPRQHPLPEGGQGSGINSYCPDLHLEGFPLDMLTSFS